MDTSSGASIAPSITAMESLSINSSLSKIDINDSPMVKQETVKEGTLGKQTEGEQTTPVRAPIPATESPSIANTPVDDTNGAETVGQWAHREAFDYPSLTATRDAELPRSQPYGDWLASAERYEWKDDYGDVAPRNEALERMLFGLDDDEPCGAGIDFSRYVCPVLALLSSHRLQ